MLIEHSDPALISLYAGKVSKYAVKYFTWEETTDTFDSFLS
ncbi:hypothetical protein AALM99_00820 [Lactococcus muris]|uniref:Uncharacterized protein n=1 Tax=Lactococcus muris TaxID=2941330 RepID=A0ABV4D5E9_9LACT